MLQIENLEKEFIMHIRGDAEIEGFDCISFSAKAGTLIAVTGPSGSGKSSLLKCIYRTYTPTGGHTYYTCEDGNVVDLAVAEPWEIIRLRATEIGYVSQFFSVIPRVSAIDILTNTQTARGIPSKSARERAAEYLEKVGISPQLWDMYPATFSGGEKQRLNIANALITRPRLLLLDEPTAFLDIRHQFSLMDLLQQLAREGKTVVVALHELGLALSYCQRLLLLKDGLPLAWGPPGQVYQSGHIQEAFGVNVIQAAPGQYLFSSRDKS